jgi:hypothetical protein
MKTGSAGVVFAILLAASGAARGQQKQITAREVVAQIQQQIGLPWNRETVDTFKAGNPDSPVRGIAVTMMATLDVLESASAKGLNFVITHEPTFYSHLDTPEGLPESDPVWGRKKHSSKSMGWWSGASTTTGTCASQTALRLAWCMP